MASTSEHSRYLDLLCRQRTAAQLLTPHTVGDIQALVYKLGAVQAQHIEMCQWALCHRLGYSKKAGAAVQRSTEEAVANGQIIRTHVLRPTWQLVNAVDLLWMLQLSAPSIKKSLFARDKHIGIIEKEYIKSDQAICRILEDQPGLSKKELTEELLKNGFPMDEYRSNHYIMHAELEGLICSSTISGGQHGYGLVENVLGGQYEAAVSLKKQLQDLDAVQELARRYFSTRGPASLQDFCWWSGLSISKIKKALAGMEGELQRWNSGLNSDLKNGELLMDYIAPAAKKSSSTPPVSADNKQGQGEMQLLAAFDEYLISYKDRTAMLPEAYHRSIIASNGLFRPSVMLDGQIVAGWQVQKAAGRNKGLKITLLPFTPLKVATQKKWLELIGPAAFKYATFKEASLEALTIG